MLQDKTIEDLIKLDQFAKGQVKKFPLKRFLYPHLKYLLTETKQMT